MMNVAVIISVYQHDDPDHFEESLLSIINQELPVGLLNRIYLGVDGYIGNDIKDIIDRNKNSIYMILYNSENIGLAATLNRLIYETKDEEYIFRMDSDDRSLPQRFARQIMYMEENKQIDILGTAIIEHDLVSGDKRIVRFATDPASARRDISKRPPLAHPTACFRRSVFEAVGGYPIVPFSEDVALWFKCLEADMKFDNLPEPLYEFTINANFWKRRGLRKAWNEYLTWSRGVHRLDGVTWRQIYPLARLLMRVGPKKLQKILYGKFLRRQIALDGP